MLEKRDIWTPRQIEICTEYAKGNDSLAKGMLSNNADAVGLLEAVMKDKLLNSLIRERITLRIAGLTHSYAMHNYDGYDDELERSAEVKSEQHCSINGRNYQVTGGGAFGIQGYDSIERLVNDNPVMLMSAFIDGRLGYIVSFDFNDSKIATRLEDTVDRRKFDDAKTQPKFLWSDWINAKSLEVTYFNSVYVDMLSPYVSSDLIRGIRKKWVFQNDLRQSLLEEIELQTFVNIPSLDFDSSQSTKTDSTQQTPILCTEEID